MPDASRPPDGETTDRARTGSTASHATPEPLVPDIVPATSATREQLRDLAALLALPRLWRRLDQFAIASSLLDVIVSLLRLDGACVAIVRSDGTTLFEDARPKTGPAARELGEALQRVARAERSEVVTIPNPIGSGTLRVMHLVPHVDTDRVAILAAAARPAFPTDAESFLCRVAVEQAMLAIHTSRLLEGLRTANAAKSTFLATMSHELRTPLNAIVGYSALLQAEIAGALQPLQKQHVTRIESAARHLIEIIEGILSFARLEAGRERVNLQELHVADLVGDVVALIEPLARGKALNMVVRINDPELRVVSDSAKVRQILLNLLSNAVKFTAAGEVNLEVGRAGDDVLMIVTDTGSGVAPQNREQIFEPFRQIGESTGGRAPGTGLGLSVSRHLARLLGGDVTLENGDGAGSTFVARLPVRSVEQPDGAAMHSPM